MCRGEYGDDYGDGFEEIEDRHAFVRKVFLIVGVQLLITMAICIPFIFVEEVKHFALNSRNSWIYWLCMGIVIFIMLLLGCFQAVRRSMPVNLILLFILTVAEAYMIGRFCAIRYPIQVLMAFGITVVICLALIIFALQTKCDFTGIGPYLMVVCIVLLIASIVSIFIRNRILQIVISSVAVLLFSIYLVVDVQLMLGGKHKYEFDQEDYILAAINIYIDIISIFVHILNLIGLTWED